MRTKLKTHFTLFPKALGIGWIDGPALCEATARGGSQPRTTTERSIVTPAPDTCEHGYAQGCRACNPDGPRA